MKGRNSTVISLRAVLNLLFAGYQNKIQYKNDTYTALPLNFSIIEQRQSVFTV
jgi:hypothetical protein